MCGKEKHHALNNGSSSRAENQRKRNSNTGKGHDSRNIDAVHGQRHKRRGRDRDAVQNQVESAQRVGQVAQRGIQVASLLVDGEHGALHFFRGDGAAVVPVKGLERCLGRLVIWKVSTECITQIERERNQFQLCLRSE